MSNYLQLNVPLIGFSIGRKKKKTLHYLYYHNNTTTINEDK